MIPTLDGFHTMIDGDASDVRLWDSGLAHTFCLEAVQFADMLLIEGPFTTHHRTIIASVAVLAESHVSVHLDLESGAAHVDLFSCRAFDEEGFARLAVEAFHLKRYRVTSVRRDAPPEE